MIVISDTNIIYSCFYSRKGVIATILNDKKKSIQFIAPDYLLNEVKEHLPKAEANALLKEFTKNITFFKVDDIPQKYVDKAEEIAQSIDPDDFPFIALHLEKGHKIWTCDLKLINGLKEMGYDICVTTKDIKEKRYKKTNGLK